MILEEDVNGFRSRGGNKKSEKKGKNKKVSLTRLEI